MAETNQEKIYVPRSIVREKTFERSGKTILTLSLHADTVAKFLRDHADDKGFVTLGASRTRELGRYGQTHCLWLDTWKPDPNRKQAAPTASPSPKVGAGQPSQFPPDDDDVPF